MKLKRESWILLRGGESGELCGEADLCSVSSSLIAFAFKSIKKVISNSTL
jgi:hypothetical protein